MTLKTDERIKQNYCFHEYLITIREGGGKEIQGYICKSCNKFFTQEEVDKFKD